MELLLDTPQNEDQHNLTKVIAESANSLLTIVNDILDFSKIEQGKMDMVNVDLNVHEIISKTADSLRSRIKPDRVRIVLPETCSARYHGDPHRLRQVLNNLIGNAIKFTSDGDIIISVKQSDQKLFIAVSDTGIGIDEAAQKRLFQPFTQVDDSSSRRFGGTGLGLSISQRLVELMGGHIQVASTAGKGSTFTIELPWQPIAPQEAEPLPVRSTRKQALVDEPDFFATLADKTVLIVEDNQVNQMITQRMLAQYVGQIITADHGEMALAIVADVAPDLILMDVQMPIMDGHAATRAIRKLNDP